MIVLNLKYVFPCFYWQLVVTRGCIHHGPFPRTCCAQSPYISRVFPISELFLNQHNLTNRKYLYIFIIALRSPQLCFCIECITGMLQCRSISTLRRSSCEKHCTVLFPNLHHHSACCYCPVNRIYRNLLP